jgi:hypothetical protein
MVKIVGSTGKRRIMSRFPTVHRVARGAILAAQVRRVVQPV